MKQNNTVLNIADYPVIFDAPERLIFPFSWVQHIPFAFFLVEMLKPGILVELGAHSGNSYNSFCQAVKRLMLNTRCFAVDTWKGDSQAGFYDESVFAELKQYQEKHYPGFSTLLQMSFDDGLSHFHDKTIDLLHIDGFHTYESVKHDLDGWLPKMSNKGVILFHDTIEKQSGFGVWKLWEEISAKYPSFNFTFGHGLGVLAVGNYIPQKVVKILEEFRNNDFYATFFESLGLLNELRHLATLQDSVNRKLISKLVIKTRDNVFDDNSAVRLIFEDSPDEIVFDVGVFEGIRSFRFHPHNEAVVVEIGNVQLKYGDDKLVTCKLSGSTAINPGERKMIFENENSFVSFDNPLPDNEKIAQVLIQLNYFSKDKNAVRAIINNKNERLEKVLNTLHVSGQELKNEKRQNDKLRGTITQLYSNLENKTYINKLNGRLLKEKNDEIVRLFQSITEKNKEIEDKRRIISEVNNDNCQKELSLQKVIGDLQKVEDELFLIKSSKAFKLIAKSREVRSRIKSLVTFETSLEKNEFVQDLNLIENSELFNLEYYISSNPDLIFDKMSPAEHYLTVGGFQKRNPSKQFDSNTYLTINNDVAELGINPLLHYLKFGKIENRRIEPLPQAQEVEKVSVKPEGNQVKKKAPIKKADVILDDKTRSQIQQIRSSGVFDEEYYLKTYNDVQFANNDPVAHFVKYGADENRNPNASFDTVFYRLMYLSPNEKINPLIHWLTVGQKEGCCTNWESNFEKAESETTSTDVLFISHDASVTGAPKILIDIIEWVKTNTLISFKIILLHGGPWMQRFASLGDCIVYSELISEYPKNEVNHIIHQFIGNKLKVVYLNTIVSLKDFEEIVGKRNVSAICHVHELQKTFEFFNITPNHFSEKIKRYIAASPPVKENLVERYKIADKKVDVVYPWINPQDFDFSKSEKLAVREEMDLPPDKVVVFGCGSFDHRKGADIFVEAANQLKKRGNSNFVFCWIGDIYNDFGYETIERASSLNISDLLIFSGIHENPARCFLAGDIFLLPSREDPFPLVCLEAANARLPVICFDKAGGMPSFVQDDAGFVVPFENIEIMVQRIEELIRDHTLARKMGDCAFDKLLSHYSAHLAIPKVVDIIKMTGRIKPKVSVIVPNYNYGRFLQKRLDTIFNQSFSNFEVIILDDASSDNSLEIIDNYRHKKNIKVLVNTKNSGSAFQQWAKGIEMAAGDLIWVAEADDYCDENFLSVMVKALENPDVAIAYSNSYTVDAFGKITGDYEEYYQKVDPVHWKRNYTCSDTEEINVGLGIKNTIPNASAVVFRKDENTLEYVKIASQFRFSGDWHFYLQLLKGKKISFINARLNYHRKHDSTITKHFHEEEFGQTILDELQIIHRYIHKNFILSHNYYHRWDYYVSEQVAFLFPSMKDINMVYQYNEISGMIKEKQQGLSKVGIFVSNKADASGAPQNLLALIRHFSEIGHYYCITFSLTGGVLLDEFKKFGESYVIGSDNVIAENNLPLSEYLNNLRVRPDFVLVNTISCGNPIPVFKGAGLKVISFIHDYTYAHHKNYLSMYYEMSDLIVYSTEYMLEFNKKDYPLPSEKTVIIPQGLYKMEILDIDAEEARIRIRKEFSIDNNDCIVLGCGSIDARKGVDIFINTAIQCLNQWNDDRSLHFIWLGGELKSNSTELYERFLARDLINSRQKEHIHFINTTLNVAPYYVSADLFFLSSREDPFPTVVHEAMAAGLPIVGFKNAGGAAEYILRTGGRLVNYQQTHEAVQTIIEMLNIHSDELEKIRRNGKEIVTEELSYMNYYQSIVALLNKNQVISALT